MKTIVFVPVLMPGMPWALAPEFFVLGVDKKVAHFHEGVGVGVEDSMENFSRESLT
jgi:hypothetical protein